MIGDWLVDTIYVARQTGRNASGDPAFTTPVAVKCRVEVDTRLIVTPSGTEQQANHKIGTLTEIRQTDRVWLPGADSSVAAQAKRPILVTAATRKSGGDALYEVFL